MFPKTHSQECKWAAHSLRRPCVAMCPQWKYRRKTIFWAVHLRFLGYQDGRALAFTSEVLSHLSGLEEGKATCILSTKKCRTLGIVNTWLFSMVVGRLVSSMPECTFGVHQSNHATIHNHNTQPAARVQAEILDRCNEGKEKVQIFLFKVN